MQVLRHPQGRPPLRVVLQAVVGVADGSPGAQRGGHAVAEDLGVDGGGGAGRLGSRRGILVGVDPGTKQRNEEIVVNDKKSFR